MKILGFSFTKISAERLSNQAEGINPPTTNINLSEIKEAKADFLNEKEKVVGIKFITAISYDPNCAKIELSGNILVSLDTLTFKQVLDEWKKKKIPEEFGRVISNLVLRKSSLRALQLEEELALPPHIPMPFFKPQDKKE